MASCRGEYPLVRDPSIFVNIAAYRDTECQWTVKDLFEKARNPDRIFVGICWQFVPEEDADCFLIHTRPEQCRVVEVHARDSRGACWARHRGQSLWQGEDFVLQIDSHMRFPRNWDDLMLETLARCPSPKPVLSSYPSAYIPPDTITSTVISTMFARGFDSQGVLKLHSRGIAPKDAPPEPQRNPFVAAGLLFADSRIRTAVPYDPYLYFLGEEVALAARLWTHGWDVYAPNVVLAWHDYGKRPTRKRHWDDNAEWTKLNDLSYKRFRHLLGMDVCMDADVLADIDRYGLGRERSLEAFQVYSGVDFKQRLINGKTSEELLAEAPVEERRAHHRDVFTNIWRGNGWGAVETRSGGGSTMAATQAIRQELPRLFQFLGIHSLVDAGCGDLNWMQAISGGLDLYLGLDVVEEMIDEARRHYGCRRGHFFNVTDITLDDLPKVDAILCRDVLTHLPDQIVNQALAHFKDSGARFLIATTHPTSGRNDPIAVGGWRPIDLTAAPFNLPLPNILISEGLSGSAKALGVWSLDMVP